MKKRTLKTAVCALLAAVTAIGFSSCNLEAKSAYDIAVSQGFQGTEAEWIASLKGSDGKDAESITIDDIYESWKEKDGNANKSFNDFLQEYLQVEYNENNNTQQIAKNLTSAVSIYCGLCNVSYNWGRFTYSWGISAGSGVIYRMNDSGNAYILTNYHVIYDKYAQNGELVDEAYDNGNGFVDNSNIFVYLYGAVGKNYLSAKTNASGKQIGYTDTSGTAVSASYVGGSMLYDVAVLKVEGSEILKNSTATQAVTSKNGVTAGEKVYAIGNASGSGISVSAGAVSVESEYITMTAADESTTTAFHVLRTDTAINPGNSGGGLFNAAGELVGIVNAKSTSSSSGTAIENMGYALPIADVEAIAQNIIYSHESTSNTGKIGWASKPYFGINLFAGNPRNEWDEGKNKLVLKETLTVSSLEDTGLGVGIFKEGDEISAVKIIREGTDIINKTVNLRADFQNAILYARAGDTIEITVIRSGKEETLLFENLQKSDFVKIQ
ncbi:MAG: S1C family serine protease [Candidatus Borkfalkiaceae bacterium]|nr:S1C family serine protease [Clostridia bacterium]MDY6223955.1 S1C family serine protease [Christensenellaceae bacterium]